MAEPALSVRSSRAGVALAALVAVAVVCAGTLPGEALAQRAGRAARGDRTRKGGDDHGGVRGAEGKGHDAGRGGKRGGKGRKRGEVVDGPSRRYPSLPLLKRRIRCPDDMVAVAGRVCVDRFESSLVEPSTHEPASPFFPPTQKLAAWSFEKWSAARDEAPEGSLARTMPLPEVPGFQRQPFTVKAMSWPGGTPNGYVSGELAGQACRAAGKRLCTEGEWVTACRGERQTKFPYGNTYKPGLCNVFREEHPAHVLHGDSSSNLLDPRLNLVTVEGRPLLRSTGDTPACASRWGDDAVYDMVGNLDEWVDDEGGTFAGGFYSRSTRNGCDARVRNHPINYFDYSTGVRCCKDPD